MSVPAATSTHDRHLDVQLLRMFEYLDLEGESGKPAEVEIRLCNSQYMTVAAGGSRTHSSPDRPPFATYEVTLDHDAPRFWRRYTDDVGLLFAHVPRLLITHHVIRNGGLEWVAHPVLTPSEPPRLQPPPACPGWYK